MRCRRLHYIWLAVFVLGGWKIRGFSTWDRTEAALQLWLFYRDDASGRHYSKEAPWHDFVFKIHLNVQRCLGKRNEKRNRQTSCALGMQEPCDAFMLILLSCCSRWHEKTKRTKVILSWYWNDPSQHHSIVFLPSQTDARCCCYRCRSLENISLVFTRQ